MNRDNELFRSSVTDEWNTPRPRAETELPEPPRWQQRRDRRRRLVRRALGMAAPVAAVAVIAVAMTHYASGVCPVCHQPDCHYFWGSPNAERGQIVLTGDLTEQTAAENTAPDRMTWQEIAFGDTAESREEMAYLKLPDGSYAGLCEDDPGSAFADSDVSADWYSDGWGGRPGDDAQYVEYYYYTDSREPVAYLQLLYLPDGSAPRETETYGSDTLLPLLAHSYACAVRPGKTDGLWVRAYSFNTALPVQKLLDAVKESLLPAPTGKIAVGQTLWFDPGQELELLLSYGSSNAGKLDTMTKTDGSEENYAIRQTPDSGIYEFQPAGTAQTRGKDETWDNLLEIYLSRYDWNEGLSCWNRLYEEAPASGHTPMGMAVPLQDVTENGVDYAVYLEYDRKTDTGDFAARRLFFVPKAEPTAAIVIWVEQDDQKPVNAAALHGLWGSTVEELVPGDSWRSMLARFTPAETRQAEPAAETPAETPTPTATPVPAMALSDEFPYLLPDLHLAQTPDAAWVSSHRGEDFTAEALQQANRADTLLEPGSGRALVAVRKSWDTTLIEGGNVSVELADEPRLNTELYTWLGGDGTLYWYRNTNGLGTDVYCELHPDGLSYRYAWTAEGPQSFTVYPCRDAVAAWYEDNPLLGIADFSGTPLAYDAATDPNDYAAYTVGASYALPLWINDPDAYAEAFGEEDPATTDGKMYTLYLDDQMRVLSMLYTYGLGTSIVTPDYTVFGVVEELPDLEDALDQFVPYTSVGCTLNVNGTAYTVPLYHEVDNLVTVNRPDAVIAADQPVYTADGQTQQLTDGQPFRVEYATTLDITYTP